MMFSLLGMVGMNGISDKELAKIQTGLPDGDTGAATAALVAIIITGYFAFFPRYADMILSSSASSFAGPLFTIRPCSTTHAL